MIVEFENNIPVSIFITAIIYWKDRRRFILKSKLVTPIQDPVFFITTTNCIQDLKIISSSNKGFGVVAVRKNVVDIHFFELK